MVTYHVRGSLTMNGVVFTVTAENAEMARRKVKDGDFDDFDTSGAEAVDWEMNSATVENIG